MLKRMRKIALVLCLTMMFAGCVQTSNTITINKDNSAELLKTFAIDSSSQTMSGDLKSSQAKFVANFKENYPNSTIMKSKEGENIIARGVVKFSDITKEDIMKKETAYTSVSKGNKFNCQKKGKNTDCTFDVNVNLKYPELEKKLEELGMTSKDLPDYELTIKIPEKATSHNANYYDVEKFIYVWEIPWGQTTPVKLKFSFAE